MEPFPRKTLPVAPSSPAPALWINAAGADDDESEDEVLAPRTPPAATMAAAVDAPKMLLADSCARDGKRLSKPPQQLGCSVQVGGGPVLVPEATKTVVFPPTVSAASGPFSASAADEEDDGEELAPQTPPAVPSPTAPSAVLQPAPALVDEDEAKLSSFSASTDDEEDDGEELAPQTPTAAPSPTVPSDMPRCAPVDEDEAKMGPFSASADDEEDDREEAPQTSPAAPSPMAPSAVSRPVLVNEDEAKLALVNCFSSVSPAAATSLPRLQCVKSCVQREMEEREEGWVKVGHGGRPCREPSSLLRK
jgi:hypothetical protein